MEKSIHLINPKEGAIGYYNMEVLSAWGIGNFVSLADLTMPTVAALVPPDWKVTIRDERLQKLDLEVDAAVIGITGKVSQRDRMIELAEAFRARGKLVVIGGPYATLNPDDMRPHCDILVVGEIEEIAAGMFAEIASGKWQREYHGTKPDLRSSPMPRWDLYPRRGALAGQVQTSRGCPFECEFCDVIQYLGRKQRWKEPAQVIAELDDLYRIGHRHVYLADDNLTVVRRRARELLEAIAAWNDTRPSGRVRFSTQLSIDIARDDDMLRLCARAGLQSVFIGIETPNEESLAETKKRQNLRIDLAEEISKFIRHGISATIGLIVGFDNDRPDIFLRQRAFVDRLPVPLANVGILVAPAKTPLRARMAAEGRLVGDDRVGAGNLLRTNIVPKNMTYDQLMEGTRWLLHQIYDPRAFRDRLEKYAELSPQVDRTDTRAPSEKERQLHLRLAKYGDGERKLVRRTWEIVHARPNLRVEILYAMMVYCQTRYMLEVQDIWRPELVGAPAPDWMHAGRDAPPPAPVPAGSAAAMVGVA